jgi:hypothetical protein
MHKERSGPNCTVVLVPLRDGRGVIKCEAGNLTVATNALVHANWLGHLGAAAVNTPGSGDGGGTTVSWGGGGGYGGVGGNSAGGAGGGGRVAVVFTRLFWAYTNQVNVAGETDYVYGDPANVNGKTGTVYWLEIPPVGGLLLLLR